MDLAYGMACFIVASFCAPLTCAANSVISVPTDIQHFGPLVVAATHDDSPDPETYRSELFSGNATERMRLLRVIGFGSIPELQELWSVFLRDHKEEDSDKVISQ